MEGELTQVGMRQHYNLGKINKKRYPSIFDGGPLGKDEYWIRSTEVNRTMMSAFSQMIGLTYPFSKSQKVHFKNSDHLLNPPLPKRYLNIIKDQPIKFKTALPFGLKPFPIHTSFHDRDIEMALDEKFCESNLQRKKQALFDINKELENDKKFNSLINKVKKRYNLGVGWGSKMTKFKQCAELGDLIDQDTMNNPKPLIPKSDALYPRLMRCKALDIIYRYREKMTSKIAATPVLEMIIDFFEKKKHLGQNYPLKFIFFSAHDTTVAGQLASLGYYRGQIQCYIDAIKSDLDEDKCKRQPRVASSLVWELIQDKKSWFSVRVSFNGEYLDVCNKRNDSEFFKCSLVEFIDNMRENHMVDDINKECGILVFKKSKNGKGGHDYDSQNFMSGGLKSKIILCQFIFIVAVFLGLAIMYHKLGKLKEQFSMFDGLQDFEIQGLKN